MKRRNRLIAWISVLFLGCMLLPQPGIVQAVASDGAFQQAFVKVDGTFDTQTAGFPMDYRFDFSGHLDGKNYYALVPLGFFHAAKESGQIVTIVDNIGVEYRYAPADIADIAPENFGATVKVGGRYRATASYKTVSYTHLDVYKRQPLKHLRRQAHERDLLRLEIGQDMPLGKHLVGIPCGAFHSVLHLLQPLPQPVCEQYVFGIGHVAVLVLLQQIAERLLRFPLFHLVHLELQAYPFGMRLASIVRDVEYRVIDISFYPVSYTHLKFIMSSPY